MKRNKKNSNTTSRIICALSIFIIVFTICTTVHKSTKPIIINNIEYEANINKDSTSLYLSDIPDEKYVVKKSGWKEIFKDKAGDGNKISVRVEGGAYTFDKGMWAHAASTLVYDISEYSNTYKYFTAYIGLNTTAASSSDGVTFTISTSNDNKTWTVEKATGIVKPGSNAEYVEINIQGKKYLKLETGVGDKKNNGNDHSVFADAKLVKELDNKSAVKSVEEFDKFIKEKYANATLDNKEYELLLLQRDFVSKVGNFAIKVFLGTSDENKKAFEWLFNDVDNLRMYIMGGAPNGGSYANSLSVLSRLYYNYKDDFSNPKPINNKWESGLTLGEVYKKLAISIALTHSNTIGLWMWSAPVENQSDALRRYAIYKYLYDNEGFKANNSTDMTSWFEALKVEEMRFVVQNMIDDEEILWLNAYVKTRIAANKGNVGSLLTPHPYMAYVWPNYTQDLFFVDENKDYFNELFAVNKTNNNIGKELVDANGNKTGKIGLWDSEFVVPGNKEVPEYKIKITRGTTSRKLTKLWQNFRNKFGTGAVCGGISKSGSNIRNVFSIPAAVIGQPGHAALLYYSKLADGRGTWGIDNDVSGWTLSEKGERLLLGWGNGSYKSGKNVVYMQLGQEAINDFDNLVKAEETIMLAKVYAGDLKKQEELYRKALSIQSINLDAWLGLIDVYNNSTTKSENDYYKLAEELAEGLKNFPLPMYNLTNLIKPKLKSVVNQYQFTLLQTRTLTNASNLQTSDEIVSPSLTRTEAKYLLGQIDKTIATFSFDGDDAGKIVLSSRFDGNGVRWDYCLVGKDQCLGSNKNWKEVSFTGEEPHKWQLTKEEINNINAENDIYVHIVGVNYSEENLFKIDITEGALPKFNGADYLYGNDLENRVVGVDLKMEWRYSENDIWTSYAKSSPDLTGNKKVQVRVSATGTKLASDFATFTFTEDNQPNTRKYIPVSNITIKSYSTQSVDSGRPFYAPSAIDGNIHTMWHTDFRYNVLQQEGKPFITLELDNPRYLSALEFVQTKYKNNDPDNIKNAIVYVSIDGEKWTEAGRLENIPKPSGAIYSSNLNKIEFKEVQKAKYVKFEVETYDMFASVSMFNLFEDATKNPIPTASVAYSTTTSTNKDVVARISNTSVKIEKIENNDGKDTYTFKENGTFEFEVKYEGMEGTYKIPAKVNWIDKKVPTATVSYSTTSPTNQDVVATITPSENIIVLNNGKICKEDLPEGVEIEGSIECKDVGGNTDPLKYLFRENGTFTFEYIDKAGNIGKTTATVNNIDRVAPTVMLGYSTLEKTSKPVVVTLEEESEEITVTNNGGSKSYTFTKNGEFTFTFKDKAGNISSKTAKVTWINEQEPVKYTCKEVNGKYYDKNGNIVDKTTYEKSCGIVTEQPTKPSDDVKPTNPGGNTSTDNTNPGTVTKPSTDNNTSSSTNKPSNSTNTSTVTKPSTNTNNNTSSSTNEPSNNISTSTVTKPSTSTNNTVTTKPNTNESNNSSNNTVSDNKQENNNNNNNNITAKPVDDNKINNNEAKDNDTEIKTETKTSSRSVWYYIVPIIIIIFISFLIVTIYKNNKNN